MPVECPSDVYREQLSSLYHGLALWKPNPEGLYEQVSIGDVGYVSEGAFIRMFNVTLPWDDASNRKFGIPDRYDVLNLDNLTIHREALGKIEYYSRHVLREENANNALAASPEQAEGVTYRCRGPGALLSLPHGGHRENAIQSKVFKKYIRDHIASWFSWSRDKGLPVERMEDLVLVYGCTLVTSWAATVFDDYAADGQISLTCTELNNGGTSFHWGNIHGIVEYHDSHLDPNGRHTRKNHCVFIKCFRAKRILFWTRHLRAAAEPLPDDPDTDSSQGEEIHVTQAADITKFRYSDPLIGILDYIAETSLEGDMDLGEGDVAIAHHDDLRLIKDVEVLTADAVEQFLRDNEMPSFFMDGAMMIQHPPFQVDELEESDSRASHGSSTTVNPGIDAFAFSSRPPVQRSMKLDAPLPRSDNKEPNHEKRFTWASHAQRQGLDGVFASDKKPTSSASTLLPAQPDLISRPRSVLDEKSIPPAPPPHAQRLPQPVRPVDSSVFSEPLVHVSSTSASRTPPRSPVSPRSPWMDTREHFGPRPDIAAAANVMSSADVSWHGPGQDLIDFNVPAEQTIMQDDNTLRAIQHLLDSQSSSEGATTIMKPKTTYVLPPIPPPPPLQAIRNIGYIPPPPPLPRSPPAPISVTPTQSNNSIYLSIPLTPDNQPLDQDGSDSEAGTLWQEPMIEEDILAAKRPKTASRGPPSDQDGSDSEAGTLWQEPMIEEDILTAKGPKSADRGPPLTVKIDGQFGRQFGGPPGQASQMKRSSRSGGMTLIPNNFPPPPQHPLPFSLPQWGGRTPTTRQLLMEQSKSEGTFQDSSWPSRPSPEEVLDRLKDFFPDHDLDKPKSGMPSIPDSPSATGPGTLAPKPIFKWIRGELIGKGNTGRVYIALNATTGELIAVKQVEIPRNASDKNDTRHVTLVEALKLESKILKDLDHPNIVQYLGFEEDANFLSIFLEYVPGGSVGSCLRKYGRFEETVTKYFTEQILSGLEYLHSKGILHRDLKADSVLVEKTGICKISDFGISKRTDDIDERNVLTPMQGTVFWMAPEVVNTGKRSYNSKVDIWSVGCVVLEMWSGERPWRKEEAMAVIVKLYSSKQAPPIPSGVTLSSLADDFRMKCFAIDPDERPSAAELRKHRYLNRPPSWVFSDFSGSQEVARDDSDDD